MPGSSLNKIVFPRVSVPMRDWSSSAAGYPLALTTVRATLLASAEGPHLDPPGLETQDLVPCYGGTPKF